MTRARRADAVGNRERIVAAARLALADAADSPETVNLRLIAQAAGVGQGTLYRHFPTREHLVAEAYREEMTDLVDAVPALLAEYEPAEALTRWFARVVDYARVKRGVVAAIEASAWTDLYADQHHRLDRALDTLLERGRATGTLRTDVDATAVILLLGTLTRVPTEEWAARAPVVVDVIVNGLRPR